MSMIGHNATMTVQSLSLDDRKILRKAIIELNDSMTRASAERDLQKEIIEESNVKLGVDKKDRKSTRLNSSHVALSRMPSSA